MAKNIVFGSILFVLALSAALVRADGAVAKINSHKHMGAASCASSVCHGATQKADASKILQSEFIIWQERDPHAKAYRVLQQPKSKAIARKLGIGEPTTAKICLDCHADNVPASQRADKFQLDDGVGCEACHGGAENWIASHAAADASHVANVEQGMYPTNEPTARATLCLSCHMGTRDRMITHRIMGAGHPRLSFELDTFTWLNPHYEVDQDYVDRKGELDTSRDWALGQGVAAKNLLDQLTDSKLAWQGIFPELVLFDCHACHRPMSNRQWVSRSSQGLGPGTVRLNDANLLVFRQVLSVLEPAMGTRLANLTKQLHQATLVSKEQTFKVANQLKAELDLALPKVAAHTFDANSLAAILTQFVKDAERGEFRDYATAEQAAMATQSVIVAFEASKKLTATQSAPLKARVDDLYKTVANEERYDAGAFVAALRRVRAAAPN
jgi:hypothetical protein